MVKILVVGATGFLGNTIAKEAAQKGHKVTALVSSESQSKKKDVVQGLKSAGIEIATGSLESAQHELVNLLKTVEVVISAVNGPALAQQTALVEAAKQASTIKQFIPSEFSAFGAVGEESVPLLYGPKAKVRQALEAAGIPHTYVVSYGFATYWANGLGELGQRDRVPPAPTGDNKVPYFGSGRTKFVINMEQDIAAYTVMAIGDARVMNKQLHIRPPLNMLSQHDLIYIYEDKVFRQLCIGNRLVRSPVTEAELDAQIAGAPDDIKRTFLQLQKAFTISGTMTPLGPKDVEASALWRDHHYIPVAKYVNDLISRFSSQLAEE